MIFIINYICCNKQRLATKLSENKAPGHLLGFLLAKQPTLFMCYTPTQIASQQTYRLLHHQPSGSLGNSQIGERRVYSKHIILRYLVHTYRGIFSN